MSGLVMHVVAHPDDDLLFMSPDLAAAIASGTPTVTVVMTAGQLSGNGATDGQRARNRQKGLQDAYASMAGLVPVGDQSEWTGDLLMAAGYQLERYTLGDTDVHLVFLALRDGGLASLYANTPHLTVVTTGGLGAPQYGYNRADVIDTLTALTASYEPAQIRSLDPLPESRYAPTDHADHTASAKFVADAGIGIPVVAYRGYSIGSVPANLDPATAADKLAAFNAYRATGDGAAGDLGWTNRMYYRWPRGTSWVGHNADGRQQVFIVNPQGEVLTWWETVGGGWSQPVVLGGAGGPLASTLSVGHNLDGRMEVAGRRLSDHRIVAVRQISPNSSWSPTWSDLGNHNAGMANASQMGAPTLARHANGRLCVLVKNGGGGVSTKSQTAVGGSWGSWVDLGGTDVQDGISAVQGPDGRLEVFAATRAKVLHWYQTAPNSAFTLNSVLPSMVPASPPTAVLDATGCIRVAYRRQGGSDVAVSVQAAPGSGWSPPVTAAGPGGTGQLTAAPQDGELHLFGRDANDGVSVTQLAPAGTPGSWVSLGGQADCPAISTNPDGSVQVYAAGDQPASLAWPDETTWSPLP